MFRSWLFIVLIFLAGIIGLLGWIKDFAPYYAFASEAKSAEAIPASKSQKPGPSTEYLGELRYKFPIRFRTESGEDVVTGDYFTSTYLPVRALEALEKNGRVLVLYLPDRPQRILFEGDLQKLPRGYWSLAWGIALIFAGIALVPRRYQLARYTKYLGRGDGSEDE